MGLGAATILSALGDKNPVHIYLLAILLKPTGPGVFLRDLPWLVPLRPCALGRAHQPPQTDRNSGGLWGAADAVAF
jgi:hypothetical protein